VLVVLAECAVFGATGERFLTAGNALEVLRQCVEVGLLALALTPVVITGGIDLSVGAMMGLAAVTLGALWRDAGAPLSLAVAGALAVGLAGGALNAVVIARLRYPPLIVTLGTMSLFRGVAQGLTRGVESYAGFPAPFLFLGQGYVGGVLPAQLVPFALAAAGVRVVAARHHARAQPVRHRARGRGGALRGHPGGAAAGVGVPRLGARRGLAAVVYVAHLGQAKSDAGTGLRAAGDHRRRARRRVDLRRPRHRGRHAARAARPRRAAERAAAERHARRAGRRAHRACCSSPPSSSTGSRTGRTGRRARRPGAAARPPRRSPTPCATPRSAP
jgi:rhamnose transport system permease protein